MSLFNQLLNLCAGEVTITVNEHKRDLRPIMEFIEESQPFNHELWEQMQMKNTMIKIEASWRPMEEIVVIYHHDMEQAYQLAINEIEKRKKEINS